MVVRPMAPDVIILIMPFSSYFANSKAVPPMRLRPKKIEPENCEHVRGFLGYETECGNAYGSVPDMVQFSGIRKEITKADGNYGTLDEVVGNG